MIVNRVEVFLTSFLRDSFPLIINRRSFLTAFEILVFSPDGFGDVYVENWPSEHFSAECD